MKLGTLVRVGDRIGTICYHNLDGYGGVWGEHDFSHIDLEACGGFSDDLPRPDFMLRTPYPHPTAECVGKDFDVIDPLRDAGEER